MPFTSAAKIITAAAIKVVPKANIRDFMSIIVACEPKFQVSPEAAACATQRSPLVRLLGSSRETECTDRQAFPPLQLFVSGHGLSDQHWLKPLLPLT